MGLRLHNTLTRTKQDFVPIDPRNIRMYVCGPTVYDFAHIGNARPLIVFDVLFRLLRHIYKPEHVTYVRNITDVDDKINARAAEEYPDVPLNEAIRRVTERTEKQFHEDAAALGCLTPTFEPRATEHIAEMRAIVEALVARGCAYVEQEHALFRVAAMPDYGRLSNRSLDEMIAGARVDVAPYKHDPTDFVLWKPSKPGEPAWPSPAGISVPGRPGWHLECSAMSDKWLWQDALPRLSTEARAHPHEFDIHGGGIDLVFPHHENEIAQSRCAHGTEVMANYWLHNGFLQVEGEKMSKSLGNFVTIRELLSEGHHGSAVRFTMLKTHYRQPINWTESGLIQGSLELEGLVRFADAIEAPDTDDLPESFAEALADDLNTPLAISQLHDFQRRMIGEADPLPLYRQYKNAVRLLAGKDVSLAELRASFDRAHKIKVVRSNRQTQGNIGLDQAIDKAFDQVAAKLVAARAAARKAKNFAEADRIRAELDAMGIALKDAKDPKTGELVTTWEVKR